MAAPRRKPRPLFTVRGQKGTGLVGPSKYRIIRAPDEFRIGRVPTRPKVIYEGQ